MVVGNGLVAKGFECYEKNDNVVIFASGVSNSTEFRKREFEREFRLLKNLSINKQVLVYFSSCSIYDKTLQDTPYVLHKKEIENYISNKFENFIIFRLPTLIGNTANKNTLFNFFFNKIIDGETIPVYKKAFRYIIDIDDISKVLPKMIDDRNYWGQKVNVVLNKPISTLEIIKVFEEELKLTADTELLEKGQNFIIDNNIFLELCKKIGFNIDPEYNANVLKKYCRKLL